MLEFPLFAQLELYPYMKNALASKNPLPYWVVALSSPSTLSVTTCLPPSHIPSAARTVHRYPPLLSTLLHVDDVLSDSVLPLCIFRTLCTVIVALFTARFFVVSKLHCDERPYVELNPDALPIVALPTVFCASFIFTWKYIVSEVRNWYQ